MQRDRERLDQLSASFVYVKQRWEQNCARVSLWSLFLLFWQLLRPFDYKCPRFLKLRDEDKKQPSYINMSLQYKVSGSLIPR